MRGRPKITEELWVEIANYYEEGHTLGECSVKFGVTRQWISRKLKARGVVVRQQFEPSRPEKIKNLPAHHKKRFGLDQEEPRDTSNSSLRKTNPPGAPPTRRIIPLDEQTEVSSNYEKKV